MFRRLKAAPLLSAILLIAAVACAAVWAVPGSSASTARRSSAPAAAVNRLVLTLALPHQAALDRYAAAVYDRRSPDFHHFLTPAQFTRRFGASTAEVHQVQSRLRAMGYVSSTPSVNRLFVTVRAQTGRRADAAGALTSGLGALISGVVTPADMPTLAPQLSATAARAGSAFRSASVRKGVDGGATPCEAAAANGGYTAPQLASAYNFNSLYASGFHGEGMSAAVVEFAGYHAGNIAAFDRCYDDHTPVTTDVVDGGVGAPANGAEIEVTLDIDILEEMAPQLAHLYVIEAPNGGTGEIDAFNSFVTQDKAPVLSESWGDCEQSDSQAYELLLGRIQEEGAAQGQQMFTAAGDSGSTECSTDPLPTGTSVSADAEDAQPWITGVGGTDLSVDSTKAGATVHREDVWNDGDGAGGGGESVTWTMPSYQQSYLSATGDRVPGLTDDCGAPAGQGCRMEPDISMEADGEEGGADPRQWDVPKGPIPPQFHGTGDRGAPGFTMYCASRNCGAGGGWERVAGTSGATPLAAAAAVLWDQDATAAHVSLGFLNPLLYGIASNPTSYARDFYDVTTGSNDDQYTAFACLVGCTRLFKAGPGYDMATGLGAVNVGNLATDLISAAGGITLTPDSERMYGYTDGGPTTTAPVSVTAPSIAGADTSYSASSSASWLVVSPGSSSGSLSWHVDPTGLAAGTYTGQITVTGANASTSTLAVTYTVTPPAKIKLVTPTLKFSEQQVKPAGAKQIQTCTNPLWGDELEYHGVLPGSAGYSFPGDETASARRTLTFVNGGGAGSQLHFSIDQTGTLWISNDLDPNHDLRGVQLKPGQPLVPSVGTLAEDHRAHIKLVSLANTNAIASQPALQQGTYHAFITVHDLADPADSVRVPVTLKLGNGRGTPAITLSSHGRAVGVTPGQSGSFMLRVGNSGACGYSYSLGTSTPWLTAGRLRHSGVIAAHASKRVAIRFHVPAATPAGVYHESIMITSVNAAQVEEKIPVTFTVS